MLVNPPTVEDFDPTLEGNLFDDFESVLVDATNQFCSDKFIAQFSGIGGGYAGDGTGLGTIIVPSVSAVGSLCVISAGSSGASINPRFGGDLKIKFRIGPRDAADAAQQYLCEFGLLDATLGVSVNGVGWRCDFNSGQAVNPFVVNAGVRTSLTSTSGLPYFGLWFTQNKFHTYDIIMPASGGAQFFHNGGLQGVATGAQIPAGPFRLSVKLSKTVGAAARNINVDYINMTQNFTVSRADVGAFAT